MSKLSGWISEAQIYENGSSKLNAMTKLIGGQLRIWIVSYSKNQFHIYMNAAFWGSCESPDQIIAFLIEEGVTPPRKEHLENLYGLTHVGKTIRHIV